MTHFDQPSDIAPGSPEEIQRFEELQKHLVHQFRDLFPDRLKPRTIVVVPSLSLDFDLLQRIEGVHHYEERMLFMLMLLRLPRTRLIYVTSMPIHPTIIDYYLHLLPGIPGTHARQRLSLLSCHDGSAIPLSQKMLDRPLLIERIRSEIAGPDSAHMTVFNATDAERSLAVRLGIPLYACDPAVIDLGSKSGGREIFKSLGIPVPDGFERLRDMQDVAKALAELKKRNPDLPKAVVKMNEGFSGEGNALFSYEGAPRKDELLGWVRAELPSRLAFEAKAETWEHYSEKFAQMSGIVESFIEGDNKRSPSVQCRINPLGEISVISTHDQDLGGPSGQIYQGCRFPADRSYCAYIQQAGLSIAEALRDGGALGRFAVDFISVKGPQGWDHYAIEINLRKGGTTHPYLMLQYLTYGDYDPETMTYYTPTGQERYYFASDDLIKPSLRGLRPDDLIDLAVCNRLHFHGATQQGVVFHLIGATSQFGKLGILCIADSHNAAKRLFDRTVNTLIDRNRLLPSV